MIEPPCLQPVGPLVTDSGPIVRWQGVAWGNAQHPRGNTVAFTDGTNFSFTRRERPHLVFNHEGAPALLTNAAQYGHGKLPGTIGDNGDASYTMVQPIRASVAAHAAA